VNVDELELVARLGEAEALPDEALAAAEASLQAAMAASSPPEPIRTRRRPRRTLVVADTAAAVAAIAAGSLALTGGATARPKSTHQATAIHRAARVQPAAVQRFQLAGYSLTLPAGYHAVSQNCPALTLPANVNVGVRTLGQNPYAAAASASGACIEVVLAAGPLATPPSGAQPVQVGPYQGYLVTNPNSIELYVGLPAAEGQHALILYANGLSPDDLIAVAASGLPPNGQGNTTVRSTPCTSNCG
jgi:hypothetical protein